MRRSGYMSHDGKRITKRQAMAEMKLIVEGRLDDPKRRAIIDRNLDADMARIRQQLADRVGPVAACQGPGDVPCNEAERRACRVGCRR